MPQLKCECSEEELKDFEELMREQAFTSRYGLLKQLVDEALKRWRMKKGKNDVPRYGVTTSLYMKEIARLEKVSEKLGKSKELIMREAVLEYCDVHLKGSQKV